MATIATYLADIKNRKMSDEELIKWFYSDDFPLNQPTGISKDDYNECLKAIFSILSTWSPTDVIGVLSASYVPKVLTAREIPQFSDFSAAVYLVPRVLSSGRYKDVGFEQMGKLIWVTSRDSVADMKYGENHAKTAELLGLVSVAPKIDITDFGRYYDSLKPELKALVISNLCLRSALMQNYFCLGEHDAQIQNDIKILAESTRNRRRSNINTMISVIREGRYAEASVIGKSKAKVSKLSSGAADYSRYIAAIRTKPFVLLAGISGTGKSRIVRELARACWEPGTDNYAAHKPVNFEMIQVKPNWHDSSELIGYVSRISSTPKFIAGDFLKFVAKAWENPNIPYFLCLDEMNLAPVEQYFAEYLSVVESRKLQDDKLTIKTDALLKPDSESWYQDLCYHLTEKESLQHQFLADGITIPQNLIVIGTVNMDETTYSFSRKVLDRAMTIEMNEVDLRGGLDKSKSAIPRIDEYCLLADAVEGYDVYPDYKEVCDTVIDFLAKVNAVLEGTPFKVAYRTRNEFLIYVVNVLKITGNKDISNDNLARALDEVTSMKILSRIEGDSRKVNFLSDPTKGLRAVVKAGLDAICGTPYNDVDSPSLQKIDSMIERLKTGFTSYWD